MKNTNIDTPEFWMERDAEFKREQEFNRNNPVSRLSWLNKELSIINWSENKEKVDAMLKEVKEIEAANESKFFEEWTVEITQQRREALNSRIRSGEFSAKPKLPSVVQINNAVKSMGWSTNELQKAIKHWGL